MTSFTTYLSPYIPNNVIFDIVVPLEHCGSTCWSAYLSEDGVNDGSQFLLVALLQPVVVRGSNGGRQAQGLGLWLRGPFHTGRTPSPERLDLLLDGTLEERQSSLEGKEAEK